MQCKTRRKMTEPPKKITQTNEYLALMSTIISAEIKTNEIHYPRISKTSTGMTRDHSTGEVSGLSVQTTPNVGANICKRAKI
jgi:hypothetical protein